MSATAFPTTFPTDAAKKIGQAILNRTFDTSLVEPLYDLVGYALHELLGGALPSPTPEPPTPVAKCSLGGVLTARNATDEELSRVGDLLLAAADSHTFGAAPNAKALPWGTIMGALLTILQGLILAFGDSPYPKPQPAPDDAPTPSGE